MIRSNGRAVQSLVGVDKIQLPFVLTFSAKVTGNVRNVFEIFLVKSSCVDL